MNVTFSLWIAVAVCALAFATSGFWQAINRRALKPALASGSPLRFAIAMMLFAIVCVAKAISLRYL